jgi:hypothetical protein
VIPKMARSIVRGMREGKTCCVVVANLQALADYTAAVQMFSAAIDRRAPRLRPKSMGHVLFLVADQNNGTDWKKYRFDQLDTDIDDVPEPHRQRALELANEAATRIVKTHDTGLVDSAGRPVRRPTPQA